MNKTDLSNILAAETGMSKVMAERTINIVIQTIMDKCAEGGQVRLLGFGTFGTRQAAKRIARNPQTGAEVVIPARCTPKFTPGNAFKAAVLGD
ncbi:MAG: HU family DNA-binding protein [Sutterellaceae bacterium]|nr:HU family DNA-binding protein [Sutterellaceae bacterium]